MNLLQLIELIIGAAENIIPVFIHNPKSQQIEGVVVGTVNGVLQGLGALPAPPAAPPAPAASIAIAKPHALEASEEIPPNNPLPGGGEPQ